MLHDESMTASTRLCWLLLLLAGCQTPVEPPARHASVPPMPCGRWSRWWRLDRLQGAGRHRLRLRVFHDFTGDMVAAARFTYVGQGSPPDARLLDFNGFDGDTIHLKGGRSLVPRRLPAATATPPAK